MNKHTLLRLALAGLASTTAISEAVEFKTNPIECMTAPVGASNFNWAFQISQNISDKIDATQSFDQLKKNISAENKIRQVVSSAIQKTLAQTIQSINPETFLQKDFNAQTEVLKIVNQFSTQLNLAIKNGLKIEQELNFQVMIAPKLSDELAARRAGGVADREIPLMLQYPNDRMTLFNNMSEYSNYTKSAQEKMSTDFFAGIAEYFNKAYECQLQKPFLTSALLNIKLTPNEVDSQISAQMVLGMPSGIEMPFTQANDQVQFEKIAFPKVNPKTLAINNGGVAIAAQYPAAIVMMKQMIMMPNVEIPVLIEFGPLGSYENGQWKRSPTLDYNNLVPKLKGHAVGNAIKNKIAIDFNIYNLRLDMAKQALTELDIYLSIGYSRFPNLTLGRINKADVDEQFQAEINKTILQQINEQKERFKRVSGGNLNDQEKASITQTAEKLGSEKGVSNDLTKQLLQVLFGVVEDYSKKVEVK